MTKEKKEDEIVIKKGDVKVGLSDYRAFISLALIGVTAFLAYVGNEAWREFMLAAGMAIAWWFKRVDE